MTKLTNDLELDSRAERLHMVGRGSAEPTFERSEAKRSERYPQPEDARSTVPTTSDPVEPVGQAVISGIISDGGTIHFDIAAEHATRFTVLHRLPGSSQYTGLVADSPENSVTLDDQPPGEHFFKAFGTNSQGNGIESVRASVTVAATLAA